MDQQLQAKQAVAAAALEYVLPRLRADSILGIGTGSTANCFIDLLGAQRRRFAAAVASSRESAE
ncbi:MAG: ribose 5-phosphate isomerase A, partial [Cellvibrionales bacterium]|nr:ribose 5-phosphate isomerase A [Cellvibrionales bacterium]